MDYMPSKETSPLLEPARHTPPPPQKTVETMTVEELKAICYDQIMLLNQTQQNISILQQELAKRSK